MRRRLQESFHLSPSNGALIGSAVGNGGGTCVSGLFGVGSGVSSSVQIPTISVSVQTEPAAAALNGHLACNGHADGIAAETTILPATGPSTTGGGSGGAASGNGAASGGGGACRPLRPGYRGLLRASERMEGERPTTGVYGIASDPSRDPSVWLPLCGGGALRQPWGARRGSG